jgi:hypothetical protein
MMMMMTVVVAVPRAQKSTTTPWAMTKTEFAPKFHQRPLVHPFSAVPLDEQPVVEDFLRSLAMMMMMMMTAAAAVTFFVVVVCLNTQ